MEHVKKKIYVHYQTKKGVFEYGHVPQKVHDTGSRHSVCSGELDF